MASKTLATIFVLSLLFCTTFTSANKCAPAKPSPTPTPVTPKPASCPIDALKLGVCADVLGLVKVKLGDPPSGTPCCALLKGLVDLEAAACLCTVIKANVLGINLNVPVTLELLISACQKTLPPGFTCPK